MIVAARCWATTVMAAQRARVGPAAGQQGRHGRGAGRGGHPRVRRVVALDRRPAQPLPGLQEVASIAKRSLKERKAVREVVLERGHVSDGNQRCSSLRPRWTCWQ